VTKFTSTLEQVAGGKPHRGWSDQDLITACRSGDQRAWEALIEKYKNLIYAIPFRYGAQADDAADIFQAVWVDLYNELPRLRNVGALRSWLMTVTGRQSLRWKRRRSRLGETDLPDDNGSEPGDDAPLAPDAMVEIEHQQQVRDAVASLSPRCRGMVEMLFLADPPAPYQEVAAQFGLALGSIGFIRGRCLQKLRKLLEDRGVQSA